MKAEELEKLSSVGKFIYKVRRKFAERQSVNRKIKKELYKIKYGKPKKEKEPLTFGKKYTIIFSIVCFVLMLFLMFATIYLHDGNIIIAIAAPLVAGTVNLALYNIRSKAENTEGGIVHDTAMLQLQADLNQYCVIAEDTEDAEG